MPANDGPVVLALEVTGPEAHRLGSASRAQFGAAGGTIGRVSGNDWVLPHALVSGHHATIDYADGTFYITDTSTNGVFVNSTQDRISKGEPCALKDGDTIIIEPFHIAASIVRGHAGTARARPEVVIRSAPRAADPFAADASFSAPLPTPVPSAQDEELDPLKLLGVAGEAAPARNVPRARDLDASSPLVDHFQPPSPSPSAPPVAHPALLIPDDYDPAAEGRESRSAVGQRPAPAREPAVPVRPAASGPGRRDVAFDLSEFLAATGLEQAAVTPQLATHLGAILRVVVDGVMDVLRSRQQIKDEFRMRATRFQPADNNPLKFSANVSDALHNLLVKRNPAYLGPVEAFEDAFDDLRNHEMAMLAGMRVAFEAMLAEFDPDRLQAQFEGRVKKKSLLGGGGANAQYWEMYRERARDLRKDVEAAFRALFGDRFVAAYEEQLDRLKSNGRGRR